MCYSFYCILKYFNKSRKVCYLWVLFFLKNLQWLPIPLKAKFNLFTMIWPSLPLWSHLLPLSLSLTLFQEWLYSLPSTVLPPGLCICFSSCLYHSSLRCPHGSQFLFIWVPVFLNSDAFLDHPLQNTPSFSSPCALKPGFVFLLDTYHLT